MIDATGIPAAGIRHVLACCEHGKHIVMVNVEADALAGPLLARRAARGGHRLFPRLRRPAGAHLRAGGLGARRGLRGRRGGQGHEIPARLPRLDAGHGVGPLRFHARDGGAAATSTRRCSTPSSTAPSRRSRWRRWRTRPASRPRPTGSRSRPAAWTTCRACCGRAPRAGSLHHAGQVEVVSSVERDGRRVFRDLRWGVYVTFAADSEYVRRCFKEYGLVTDDSGNYCAMYKPYPPDRARARHQRRLRGLAAASPRAAPTGFRGDVVATAKRDLTAGRDARRRRRLHRVRQAHARAPIRSRWADCPSASPTG